MGCSIVRIVAHDEKGVVMVTRGTLFLQTDTPRTAGLRHLHRYLQPPGTQRSEALWLPVRCSVYSSRSEGIWSHAWHRAGSRRRWIERPTAPGSSLGTLRPAELAPQTTWCAPPGLGWYAMPHTRIPRAAGGATAAGAAAGGSRGPQYPVPFPRSSCWLRTRSS